MKKRFSFFSRFYFNPENPDSEVPVYNSLCYLLCVLEKLDVDIGNANMGNCVEFLFRRNKPYGP